MSGVEPFAVLGAISSVIAIFETSKNIYDATKNAQGLHESFRKTSDNLAVILSTLYQARLLQEQAIRVHGESDDVEKRHEIEKGSRAAEAIMEHCKTNAEGLSTILATLILSKDTSRIRRYKIANGNSLPSKKRKVQSLMRETMDGLQLLHTYHFSSTMTTSKQLQAATQQLSYRSTADCEPGHHSSCHGSKTMDQGSLAMPLEQTDRRNPEATKSQEEESFSLARDSRNV